jgi:hypothetical protein
VAISHEMMVRNLNHPGLTALLLDYKETRRPQGLRDSHKAVICDRTHTIDPSKDNSFGEEKLLLKTGKVSQHIG